MAKLLQKFGSDVDAKDSRGRGLLHTAVLKDNPIMVAYLHTMSTNLEIRDNNGATALHWAANQGAYTCLSLLIALKVQINVQDNFGETPLHLAVQKNKEKEARLLLLKGADKTISNRENKTPEIYAAQLGNSNMIHLFRSGGFLEKIGVEPALKPYKRSYTPLIILVFILLLEFFGHCFFSFGCNIYIANQYLTYTFAGSCIVTAFMLVWTSTSDPGYVEHTKETTYLVGYI